MAKGEWAGPLFRRTETLKAGKSLPKGYTGTALNYSVSFILQNFRREDKEQSTNLPNTRRNILNTLRKAMLTALSGRKKPDATEWTCTEGMLTRSPNFCRLITTKGMMNTAWTTKAARVLPAI